MSIFTIMFLLCLIGLGLFLYQTLSSKNESNPIVAEYYSHLKKQEKFLKQVVDLEPELTEPKVIQDRISTGTLVTTSFNVFTATVKDSLKISMNLEFQYNFIPDMTQLNFSFRTEYVFEDSSHPDFISTLFFRTDQECSVFNSSHLSSNENEGLTQEMILPLLTHFKESIFRPELLQDFYEKYCQKITPLDHLEKEYQEISPPFRIFSYELWKYNQLVQGGYHFARQITGHQEIVSISAGENSLVFSIYSEYSDNTNPRSSKVIVFSLSEPKMSKHVTESRKQSL